MKDIELEELPKSKEFMKHAKIADGLTKETELEHGFTFCKPNDEIIVDKMCVGGECNISIGIEKCQPLSNSFHTHPISNISEHSIADLYNSAHKSFLLGTPDISCVKANNDNNILCTKSQVEDNKIHSEIWAMNKVFELNPTYEKQVRYSNEIHELCKSTNILIPIKKEKTFKEYLMEFPQ